LRQISIAAAATAITRIAPRPPTRPVVDVLVGACGATVIDAESLGAAPRLGVSKPLGLVADDGSVADAPVATAAAVAWVTVAVVVAARVDVVLAVVAGGAAVVAAVVAVCLGGATPGATYPALTGWYLQPSAPPATGW
jgi:hypothetical protein